MTGEKMEEQTEKERTRRSNKEREWNYDRKKVKDWKKEFKPQAERYSYNEKKKEIEQQKDEEWKKEY